MDELKYRRIADALLSGGAATQSTGGPTPAVTPLGQALCGNAGAGLFGLSGPMPSRPYDPRYDT